MRQYSQTGLVWGPQAAPPWTRVRRWLAPFRVASLTRRQEGAGGADNTGDAGSMNDAMSASAGARPAGQFEAFFQRHERAIAGYLWRLTGDEQTANDLTQEVFLRAWGHFDKLRDYDRPEAWLFRVATNLAMNERRRQRVAGPSMELVGDERAPGDHAERLAGMDALRTALRELPARQRAAIILREVYGYSCDEIAAMLEVSRAAAKMTLCRARQGLRASFLKEDAE